MYKKITFIAGLLALLTLPHLTHAQDYQYIPSSSFFDAFAKPRTAASLAAEQQKRSADRRAAEQAAAFAAQREEETLHGSAPAESQTSTTTTNAQAENSFISPETLSTLRLIERIQQQQQEAELRNKALSILGADLNLHSGAPLQSATGKGYGKGEIVTGKGETIPQFLPTQTVVLAPTGASSVTVLVMLVLGTVGTAVYYLKGGKAVIVE